MSDFSQGLVVSVVGLLVTFLALGVFILVMVVLQKLFPYREEAAEQSSGEPSDGIEPASTIAESTSNEEEEIAAAITAVAYLRSQHSSQLGSALLEGPGRYWASKRQSQK